MIILLITIMGMGEKENGKWRTFKEKTIKKSSEYAATSKNKIHLTNKCKEKTSLIIETEEP